MPEVYGVAAAKPRRPHGGMTARYLRGVQGARHRLAPVGSDLRSRRSRSGENRVSQGSRERQYRGYWRDRGRRETTVRSRSHLADADLRPPAAARLARDTDQSSLDRAGVRGRDLQLALGDFLQRHGQEVLRPRLDQRWSEALEAALAELVVVVVDLAGALGGRDHERVFAVDMLEQDVNFGIDHLVSSSSAARISSVSWDAARSTSSFTIT